LVGFAGIRGSGRSFVYWPYEKYEFALARDRPQNEVHISGESLIKWLIAICKTPRFSFQVEARIEIFVVVSNFFGHHVVSK